MKPSELSRSLRSIAAKIDSSRKPDRALVSRDLKRVLIAMNRTAADGLNISYPKEYDITLPDGQKYKQTLADNTPSGYDVGVENNPGEVVSYAAASRVLDELVRAPQKTAEVDLPAEAGYGASFQNSPMLIFVYYDGNTINISSGPNEHELEVTYSVPVSSFNFRKFASELLDATQ